MIVWIYEIMIVWIYGLICHPFFVLYSLSIHQISSNKGPVGITNLKQVIRLNMTVLRIQISI